MLGQTARDHDPRATHHILHEQGAREGRVSDLAHPASCEQTQSLDTFSRGAVVWEGVNRRGLTLT